MNELPVQLRTDYEGNEERMNIRFIKLACAISKHIETYLPPFQLTIKMGTFLERKNVIEFIKLMTTLEYFDFKSQFAHTIFETLVKYSYSGVGQQFQIVTFMLTNEDIQARYLAMLVECLGNNTEGEVNFSLCLLQRLMHNTLNILEGKKKGPPISSTSIENLLKISVSLASKRQLQFINPVDHCNFLKICSSSLEIMRKYSSGDKIHLKTYEQIWKSQIRIFQQLEIEVTDCVFGILIELCNFKEVTILEQMELKQNFDLIVLCSSYLILKCHNINQFWHSFLTKRVSSTLDLQHFDQLSVITLMTENLYRSSNTFQEILQKLKIADNLVLATNLMTKSNHIKRVQLREVEQLDHKSNDAKGQINLLELIEVSFKALYNPTFKIEKDGVFMRVLSEIKLIASQLGNSFQNNIEEHILLLNLLPPLKIVIKKCKNFIEIEDHIQTLIKFLMVFLNDEKESKCFEDFIILICEQLRLVLTGDQIQIQKQKMKSYHIRVHRIISNCLNTMKVQSKRIKNMGSYVRCIESLVKINKNTIFMESFEYLSKLVHIIQARSNRFDEEIHQFMSRLIKQSYYEGQGKDECFQKLYSLTVEQKRVFYLELLFDFAQTHYKDQTIVAFMTSKNADIAQICLFSPTYEYSQLRNLSYIITSQNIKKDLESSHIVLQGLYEIVNNTIYRPKLYQQIVGLIGRQRKNWNKIFRHQKVGCTLLGSFVNIMIKMIEAINDCMEENNQCKLQKTTIFQKIADQILRFVFLIANSKHRQHHSVQSEAGAVIEKIKRSIEDNRLKNFFKMQKFFKTLVTSYVYLETEVCKFSQNSLDHRIRQINKIKQFMYLETSEKTQKVTQQDQLLSVGVSRKLFRLFGSTLTGGDIGNKR